MAILIPTFDEIKKFKVIPEKGELKLLSFLETNLDDSFEVFFNPLLNGDRPDIIILRKGYGVMIIEVKDYNLSRYELDERKNWKLKGQSFNIKSPISQALKYKENLFELHIDKLLEMKIKDIKKFNIVSCAVYFHNASSDDIKKMLISPFYHDKRYMNFLKYNIDLIGNDNLNEFDFDQILKKRYLKSDRTSFLFTDDIYESFSRFLKPPIHLIEQGKVYSYSKKQKEIIYTQTRKQQRIKGVVGSGKTTVLAGRAVQAYKRTKGKVLILTYNITLKNYIHDKISDVRENFPWSSFIISNYHLFISSELNNLGVVVKVPDDFDKKNEEEKDLYFEKEYYSNIDLFERFKNDIKPYDVILIDEIQDYKRPWMDILKKYFLVPDGEYVLFGDVKQNIYSNKTESKDVVTNVIGGVTELKRCFRSDFIIKDLAIQYQKDVFRDKYEIDDFNKKTDLELGFEKIQEGSINYIYLPNEDSIISLYTIIHGNAINKGIPPNDITVLGHSISLLKRFDSYYRYASKEKTNTMFESHEMVYLMGLNFLGKNNKPEWLLEGIKLIKQENYHNQNNALTQLSVLFTLYDLFKKYRGTFDIRFERFCNKYKTTTNEYIEYRWKYKAEIDSFISEFGPSRMGSNLQMIRKNKKIHFHMNSGTIKISTIHSFKGWESEMLFLIVEKKYSGADISFDELLYTGITRSKTNLIIINLGNREYHSKLKEIVDKVK